MTDEVIVTRNVIPDDDLTKPRYIEEPCPLCEEPVTWRHILDRAQRLYGLGGGRFAHRECMLRETTGGIGHLEDHAHWCLVMHDPDGGRTRRQSALETDEWIHQNWRT